MAVLDTNQVKADDAKYVLHSWSVRSAIDPLPVAGAEGRYFWDYDGKRYLDFASQLVNVSIGHQHPKVIAAIKEQADRLCTIGPMMANDKRSELARLLAEVTPGDLAVSFFTNGGAEANENAIKLARWYTGRDKIVARYRSYHGATAGAISATGRSAPLALRARRAGDRAHPRPVHVSLSGRAPRSVPGLHGRAAPRGDPPVRESRVRRGRDPRDGDRDERRHPPPPGYLQSVREVCDRHGILLILDEVMAGFGRTGKWFACENWDVVPDIITLAKGINSGYVPLGAMTISQRIADWLADKYFAGGLTYSGHPLACAAGVASIEAFREEGIVENAAAMGEVLGDGLAALADKHESIGEVRGLGLFYGVELVKDRETREPLVPFNASGEAFAPMTKIAKAALERGLYLMTHWNVIIVAPPLTITREELDEGLEKLDEALSVAS